MADWIEFLLQGSLRQAEAARILQTTDKDLHIVTRKLKHIPGYRKDLAFAASHGFCGWKLYVSIRALAFMLKADARESERLNKMLTLFGDRCPNGSLDLCTGRAALKFFLGEGGYGHPGTRRFSDMKETAHLLLRECMAGWSLIVEVEGEERRFQAAQARTDIPSLAAANRVYRSIVPAAVPRVTAARLWATSMNAKLAAHRRSQRYPCSKGLASLAVLPRGSRLSTARHIFLVTDQVRTTVHLASCKRSESSVGGDGHHGRYRLDTLRNMGTSHEFLRRLYATICKHKALLEVFDFMARVCEVSEACIEYRSHISVSDALSHRAARWPLGSVQWFSSGGGGM